MSEDKMEKFKEMNEYVRHIALDLFRKAHSLYFNYAEACIDYDWEAGCIGNFQTLSEWKEAKLDEILSYELYRMGEEILE
jgi:hypothetical protein